ncbi:MAG: tRNA (N(6)-L-threonylcarbamoyladenosine(37)-C(2))-methylthiotransferase MtaB [Armatimonadetes bacterium]|nr:tRNA (N(6)-L-threonylcarbamoyladenosine(37)-C(2))-methylthiotransferase MtaB [Armatimonadota bacterium]
MTEDGSPRRVALYTLGCKTNQYDSGRLAEEFEASGFRLVPFGEPADVYVINTCTVTAEADREARSAARRARARRPGAVVVATGCYVAVDPAAMAAIPGVRLLNGSGLVRRVEELLAARPGADGARGDRGVGVCECGSKEATGTSTPPYSHTLMPTHPHAPALPHPHTPTLPTRTRQVLKIQEGCNYRCAYCVVPRARGKARSRPLDEVLAESRRRVESGFRELVLTGTCIGSYGQDLRPRARLVECAGAIAAIPGLARLRISSIEPWEVEEDLIELAANHPVVCRHFHLPVQSGDDGVRRRMRRPGSGEQFAALVASIREAMPDAGITTDVIVGTPGETEAEFARTLDFCREIAFSRMHVFRYSPRPFTPAAAQPDRVPRPVQDARSRALIRLGEEMADAFARRWVGSVVPVLVEGPHGRDGLLEGLTGSYIRARFPGDAALHGRMVGVEALDARAGCLIGRVVNGDE